MTGLNHVLTGAAVALLVKQPEAAVAVAFASHFVLDALPHYGSLNTNLLARNREPMFRTVVGIDTLFTILALAVVPSVLGNHVQWWLVLLCMLAALAPDFVWIYRFWWETKRQALKNRGLFTRFHKSIQWAEHPWGIFFEVGWLAALLALISVRV